MSDKDQLLLQYAKQYPNDENPYSIESQTGVEYINNFLKKRNGRRVKIVFKPGMMDGEILKYA